MKDLVIFVENDKEVDSFAVHLIEKQKKMPFENFFDCIITDASNQKEKLMITLELTHEVYTSSVYDPNGGGSKLLTMLLRAAGAKPCCFRDMRIINLRPEAQMQYSTEQLTLIEDLKQYNITFHYNGG